MSTPGTNTDATETHGHGDISTGVAGASGDGTASATRITPGNALRPEDIALEVRTGLAKPSGDVAEYALRLKRELGASRIWVNAYANHVPCYIPSTQVLAEGGYEAEAAMDYYGLPTRLAPDVEDRIVRAVRGLLPPDFATRR